MRGSSRVVVGFHVLFKVGIIDTSAVVAIAAAINNGGSAATLAAHFAAVLTTLALLYIMKTITAVYTKMLIIIRVFHTHAVGTLGIALAAIHAESAVFALFYRIKADTAVITDVVEIFGTFNAVFAAVAAFLLCLFAAAGQAKTAILAQFNTVGNIAFTAFFALLVTLHAVHIGKEITKFRIFATI